MFTQEAIKVLIFLIPGFLTKAICAHLSPSFKSESDTRFVANSLIITLIEFKIVSAIKGLNFSFLLEKMIVVDLNIALCFLYVSSVLAVLHIIIRKYDLIFKLLQFFTHETQYQTAWRAAFVENEGKYATFKYKEYEIYGAPKYISDEAMSVYVVRPQKKLINEKKFEEITGIDGILLVNNSDLITVEFQSKPVGVK